MGIFNWLGRILGGKDNAPKVVPQPPAKAAPAVGTPIDTPSRRFAETRIVEAIPTKILVIDDSPTIIAVFRKILLPAGYEMIYAESAERGITLAQAESPDLIFLDIVLPGMNGFAALRTMRKDASTKDIPIVMISGNEQATEQFYAERIGADDFLKKPFKPSDVLTRVQTLALRREAGGILRKSAMAPQTAA